MVESLREKSLISDATAINLEENFDGITSDMIKNQLKNQSRNPKGRRYYDEVKKFALTLNFYSPRAYEYLRSIFSLPHANSLIEWTSSVDCEPGMFLDVFKNLKERIQKDPTMAECALLCDAMSIKSAVTYNQSTGNYEGYVNYGDGIKVPDKNSVATEATVFMLVSFRGHWKYPIGYVLDNHLNAEDLKCLLFRCLDLCAENDIIVKCITMDGTTVNLNAMKLFGCKFGDSVETIKGTFYHESHVDCIYFVADPPHMLKLARNALGDMKNFVDNQGRKIEWKYIQLLHDEQTKQGLKFGNSISNQHIAYHRNKMNVKFACQTLSASVADAIEFLMQSGHPFFQNAEGRIEFIRVIDRLFDVLNVRNPFGKGFKCPLKQSNSTVWQSVIDLSISYLLELKCEDGAPLVKHRRKTFVIGFITSALTAKN